MLVSAVARQYVWILTSMGNLLVVEVAEGCKELEHDILCLAFSQATVALAVANQVGEEVSACA
jgi:hypothetical protein